MKKKKNKENTGVLMTEKALALAELEKWKQKPGQTINNYTSKFTDITGHTDLKDSGQRSYFLHGLTLANCMLFKLADTVTSETNKVTMFLAAKQHVIEMDSAVKNPLVTVGLVPSAAVDLFMIDVNTIAASTPHTQIHAAASRDQSDYHCSMAECCFGCGSKSYICSSGDCKAKGVYCNYCRCKGHFKTIYEDKFCSCEHGHGCGCGKTCIAVTTVDSNFTLFPRETGLQGLTSVTVAATNTETTVAATAPANQAILNLLTALLQQGFP